MEWVALTVIFATSRIFSEVGGGGGGLTIDLMNLQWWQTLIGLLATAGLSPAPWILGLATNKIQFTSTADAAYEKRVKELNDYHDSIVESKDQRYADLEATNAKLEQAVATQQVRADTTTAALAESTEVTKMMGHVIQELRQAAEEMTTNGR
jgi:hypothetical protein